MTQIALTHADVMIPTDREAELAAETGRRLAAIIENSETVAARFGSSDAETLELPATALRLLLDILEEMARGNAVTLTPINAELTTQQASDLLNVSRTHLVQLLDRRKIPHRKVGTHRRIQARDILEYRREMQQRRHDALNEMTARDQDLGLQ